MHIAIIILVGLLGLLGLLLWLRHVDRRRRANQQAVAAEPAPTGAVRVEPVRWDTAAHMRALEVRQARRRASWLEGFAWLSIAGGLVVCVGGILDGVTAPPDDTGDAATAIVAAGLSSIVVGVFLLVATSALHMLAYLVEGEGDSR